MTILDTILNFRNEIILVASIFVLFGALIGMFRFFGKQGIYTWTVICTIAANIEVMILVHAFGLDTTLGNVLFASSFLATDIMSELYGKKEANKCVKIGILTNVIFIVISQSWRLYAPLQFPEGVDPLECGQLYEPIITVFKNTPRVMFASLFAYVVCEIYDVWAYHAIWARTEKKTGNKRAYLWLRNNGSTLVSQLINVVLFNLVAFGGVFPKEVMITNLIFGYAIFIVTSIADTPFVYLARKVADKHPELVKE